MILNAKEKAVSVDQFVLSATNHHMDAEARFLRKAQQHDILCRVEARLRPQLDERHGGKTWDVRKEILEEVQGIQARSKVVCDHLQSEKGLDNGLAERLAYHGSLYEAQHGKEPSNEWLKANREILQSHELEGAVAGKASDRVTDYVCDRELANHGYKLDSVVKLFCSIA